MIYYFELKVISAKSVLVLKSGPQKIMKILKNVLKRPSFMFKKPLGHINKGKLFKNVIINQSVVFKYPSNEIR